MRWCFHVTNVLLGYIAATASAVPSQKFAARQSTGILASYDYVIVGSGPGGGPLAARLAIAGKKVLLIEAGDDQGDSVPYQVPALSLQSTEYEPMKWDYFVQHLSDPEEQKKDSKMTYRLPSGELYVGLSPPTGAEPLGVLYPRAGTLGGCGSHNALITVYPHKSDWDGIASLTGDSTWSASNMRKYFQRLENAEYLPNGVIGHGFSGWLTTSVTDLGLVIQDIKLLTVILSAASAMGKNLIGLIFSTIQGLGEVLFRDLNVDLPGRDAAEGLYQVPISVDSGIRVGPRDFVLETANAKNADGSRKYHLDLKLNTLVTKVRFDQSGPKPRAVGVDFIAGQSLYRADPRSGNAGEGTAGSVNATAEVIISAGSFNTPQLLKLSGVGPSEELASFDIPVIVDLPGVGTNLQDRYETSVIGETPTDFQIIQGCTFIRPGTDDPCLKKWREGAANGKRGIYGSNGISLGIVKKSSVAEGDPDLFIAGAPVNFPGYSPGYAAAGTADARHWSWITLKAHTRNRAGTIKLRSADPRDVPQIDFNSFQDDGAGAKDIQAVVEGMKLSRKMFESVVPLTGGFTEVWPGKNVTDEMLPEFVKNEAWGHHASCTCPIGKDGDAMAVLDSKFKVRGTEGLRVVDASVFPQIPGYYIAVPVYMVSEKAADVILGL
ncbi:choline dehydrogenase [Colletotrichum tofieldiae]|uniref:Choline dehydrogenase (GMC oxidoreductase) n=1 Tax=Colletotrichum tofieldiae TaxID=708197 RepID=A0A166VKD6_9PEZI|nr:choline dehydrogenase (GMC oxidoreductase) [Colletotrichum tofieldiae]GKT60189.1 choline dehydrogenase [Colletotrichum tofieldiae]GKT67899.1 choline dehydrogenase [Colletotrichum tofieldiae]GKT91131.1 choline dehydrogenase [Colletotrichum tofieldiae]